MPVAQLLAHGLPEPFHVLELHVFVAADRIRELRELPSSVVALGREGDELLLDDGSILVDELALDATHLRVTKDVEWGAAQKLELGERAQYRPKIYSRSEVLETRESKSRPNVGIVTVKTTRFNQKGTTVIEFKRTVMVYKRGHVPKKAASTIGGAAMRMLLDWDMPLEPFNTMVKNGTAGRTIEKVLGEIKPEAAYFAARNGKRGGTMIVDLPDASAIPKIAEHLFLAFEASVHFHPCMTPEDLKKAGMDDLGKGYA